MTTASLLLLGAAAALPAPAPTGRIIQAARPQRAAAPGPLIAVAVGVAMAVFLLADRLSVAAAALLLAATVVHHLQDLRIRRRVRATREVLAGWLGHLVADLQAGARPADALARATAELDDHAPAEVAEAVAAGAAQARWGTSPATTFLAAADHAPDLASVGHLWELSDRHGVKLAGLLSQIRDRLSARNSHDDATAASLNGPQASALILMALPLAGLAMGTAMGAAPLGLLLGGGLGGVLLVSGTGLVCAGFLWSQRIIAGARS